MATLASVNKKSDDTIRKDVIFALQWDPKLEQDNIGVAVSEGVVTLTGVVPNYWMKLEAEKTAQGVYGVRGVANDIDVRVGSHRTDAEIARAAVEALERHILIPSDKIKVTVREARLTLEGEVRWHFQRKLAESAVRKLEGVKAVTNNIIIKTDVSPFKVQEKIEDALRRSAELDARRIVVDADGSKVTLRGTVRSWSEKDEAERAAWSAPGVTSVDNLIEVVS